jgi:hypothetical protein
MQRYVSKQSVAYGVLLLALTLATFIFPQNKRATMRYVSELSIQPAAQKTAK